MAFTLAALVALVGVLLFALSANAKVARIGEILFFVGTFVFLLRVSGGETFLTLP